MKSINRKQKTKTIFMIIKSIDSYTKIFLWSEGHKVYHYQIGLPQIIYIFVFSMGLLFWVYSWGMQKKIKKIKKTLNIKFTTVQGTAFFSLFLFKYNLYKRSPVRIILKPSQPVKIANSTRCSQRVTHPSTNQAQRCLTSVIRREPVFQTSYGRLW